MDDRTAAAPGFASRASRLGLLVALVLARPVLALAGGHPEYFAAYHCDGLDLVVVALGLWLVPTLALLGVERLAGPAAHAPLLGLLLALLGIELAGEVLGLAPLTSAAPALLLAVLTTRTLAARRHGPAAQLGLWLAAAAVPAHFLLATEVAVLLGEDHRSPVPAGDARPIPVVLVVLDALPLYAMLDEAGGLDAARFPTFARLAATSTWYRQATAVHTYTASAVPAILTGRYPEANLVPVTRNFPENLFRLVGGALDLRVYEAGTRLLSLDAKSALRFRRGRAERLASILEDASQVVPIVLQGVRAGPELATAAQRFGLFEGTAGFFGARPSRDEYFTDFVAHVGTSDPPSLYFLHSILPHAPWRLLPAGDRYPPYHVNGVTMEEGTLPSGHAIQRYRWVEDPWLVRQCYQRILLQSMACDRLLDQLLKKLEATGIFDRALVIVTADHGTYVEPGRYLRELFTEDSPEVRAGTQAATQAELLPIPLFVKLPGQRQGAASDRNVEHVDLVPTIAAVLGLEVPWRVDGRSLLDPAAARARKAPRDTTYRVLELPPAIPGVAEAGAAKRAWFGPGEGWPYRLGPHDALVGRPIAELEVAPGTARVTVATPPAPQPREHLAGWVDGVGGPWFLAAAIDGVVRAVTRTGPPQEGRHPWVAFFPPTPVTAATRLEVFVVEERPTGPPRLLRSAGP